MSFNEVVLGQVIGHTSAYGWQIQNELGPLIDLFGLSETAVYPAINSLKARGLVRTVDDPSDRPHWTRRRMVVATDAGHAHFGQWLVQPYGLAPVRDEFHMKLLMARPTDVPHLLKVLDSFETAIDTQVAAVIKSCRAMRANPAFSAIGIVLVQNAHLGYLEAMKIWAQRACDTLRRHDASRADHDSPTPAA